MQHSKAAVDLLRTAQDALARSGGLLHRTGLLSMHRLGVSHLPHLSSTPTGPLLRFVASPLPSCRPAGRQDAAALHAAAGARAARGW